MSTGASAIDAAFNYGRPASIASEYVGACIRSNEGTWCDQHAALYLAGDTDCELMQKVVLVAEHIVDVARKAVAEVDR